MSEDFINKVTLDFLMNKEQYKSQVSNKISKSVNKKEKQFYRKRIYHLAKELLINKDIQQDISPDVKYSFDNFVNSCIHYFKTVDNNDIIQQDYIDIDDMKNNIHDNKKSILSSNESNFTEEADKLVMRKIKIQPNSLDNFVKRVHKPKQKEIILPKQKEINLQNPEFKNKGVIFSEKKKNINIEYESNNKKKEINETNDKTPTI